MVSKIDFYLFFVSIQNIYYLCIKYILPPVRHRNWSFLIRKMRHTNTCTRLRRQDNSRKMLKCSNLCHRALSLSPCSENAKIFIFGNFPSPKMFQFFFRLLSLSFFLPVSLCLARSLSFVLSLSVSRSLVIFLSVVNCYLFCFVFCLFDGKITYYLNNR